MIKANLVNVVHQNVIEHLSLEFDTRQLLAVRLQVQVQGGGGGISLFLQVVCLCTGVIRRYTAFITDFSNSLLSCVLSGSCVFNKCAVGSVSSAAGLWSGVRVVLVILPGYRHRVPSFYS